MSKTKNESKDKYNENAYARYTVRIRKDSLLYDSVEEFMGKTGTSLNYLINKLLDEYFSNLYYKSYSD